MSGEPLGPVNDEACRPLTDARVWAPSFAFVVLTVALRVLAGTTTGVARTLLFTVLPLAALVIVLAWLMRRGHQLAAAAVALAVTPAALAALAQSERSGAVNVLIAALVAVAVLGDWAPRRALVASFAIVVVGMCAWVSITPRSEPMVSWLDVTARTGNLLRILVSRLDESTVIPTSGWLAWWVAAGLFVGIAVVTGNVASAAAIPLAIATTAVAAGALLRWRGAPDIADGRWILTAAVVFAGASRHVEARVGGRVASAVAVLVAAMWVMAVVQLART